MLEVLDGAGLGSEAEEILAHLGVTEPGNWEGTNVLNLRDGSWSQRPPGWERARAALLDRRADRVRPGLDDKRLTSWNALMIAALAESGASLREPRYLDAASACGEFLLEGMRDAEGRLLRSYNRGRAHLNAYLEDHAFLIEALLALYEATFEPRWYEAARETAESMIERFGDEARGGFFTTSDDHEQLIARRKDLDDHPIPSGNASAALGLLRLEALSGDRRWGEWGEGVLRLLAGPAEQHPQALAYLLTAIDFHLSPTREVALIGPATGDRNSTAELEAAVRARYRPHLVLAGGVEGSAEPALLTNRAAAGDAAAAYVCERFTCKAPVSTPEALRALLD